MPRLPRGSVETESSMRAYTFAALLLTAGASADEPETRIPSELRECVAIQRNTERLACFDRGIENLRAPGATTAAGAESSFGLFAQTPAPARAGDPPRAEIESLEARVTSIAAAADGSAVLALDNGQSWRQIGSNASLLLKVGDTVVIRRAALGSFQLSTPTGRAAKVKRVR
jgi:hypothetical protein